MSGDRATASILDDPPGLCLRRMTVPVLLALSALASFSVVDMYWISRLGTSQVAAVSFVLPITLMVSGVFLGLGVGVTSEIARACGSGDTAGSREYAMHGLTLGCALCAGLALAGVSYQAEVLELIGVQPELRPMASEYFVPWLWGSVLLALPLMGTAALRGAGETRSTASILLLGGAVNAVLAPLLIFGLGPMPTLGVRGAAIATVAANGCGSAMTLWLMRERGLLVLQRAAPSKLLHCWKSILAIGVPNVLGQLTLPLGASILTGLISKFGPSAVAAFGIGQQISNVLLMVSRSVAAALGPFVGQNHAAAYTARVAEGTAWALRFVAGVGALGCLGVIALAVPMSEAFTGDANMTQALRLFLYIGSWGFAPMGAINVTSAVYNALGQATRGLSLRLAANVLITVGAAFVGMRVFGLPGAFGGLLVGQSFGSVLGVLWLWRDGYLSVGRLAAV